MLNYTETRASTTARLEDVTVAMEGSESLREPRKHVMHELRGEKDNLHLMRAVTG